jgi:hypothetical protein
MFLLISLFYFVVWGIELYASCMLGKWYTTELALWLANSIFPLSRKLLLYEKILIVELRGQKIQTFLGWG